jgi:hypothetical protein
VLPGRHRRAPPWVIDVRRRSRRAALIPNEPARSLSAPQNSGQLHEAQACPQPPWRRGGVVARHRLGAERAEACQDRISRAAAVFCVCEPHQGGRACISWGTSRARTSLRHRNNFRRLGQSSPVKTFTFELRVENTHLGQGFRQTMPAWRFAQHQGRAVQFAWVIGFEPRNVQRNNPVEPTSFAVPDYPIEVHLLLAAS